MSSVKEEETLADTIAIKAKKVLRNNSNKLSWKECTNAYLLYKLNLQVDLLKNALINNYEHDISRHSINIINYTSFVIDNNTENK